MNKKIVRALVLIISVIVIFSMAAFRISQIENKHQANLAISEECIKNGDTVVIEEQFLALTKVTCEEN